MNAQQIHTFLLTKLVKYLTECPFCWEDKSIISMFKILYCNCNIYFLNKQ